MWFCLQKFMKPTHFQGFKKVSDQTRIFLLEKNYFHFSANSPQFYSEFTPILNLPQIYRKFITILLWFYSNSPSNWIYSIFTLNLLQFYPQFTPNLIKFYSDFTPIYSNFNPILLKFNYIFTQNSLQFFSKFTPDSI